MSLRAPRGRLPLLFVVVLITTILPSATVSGSDSLDDSVLNREPQLTPDALGNGSILGLQYGSAAENLALIEPPAASPGGSASLEYPLVIPKGRGIAPALSLTYDAGAGSSWTGVGWDLSLGSISVDSRWGAPRFDPDFETETYLLDGDMLSPNAIRSNLEDPNAARIAERQDWTRRVETEYEYIVRHGDSPKNYFWEVVDKMGGVRWYGGYPDGGGPFGDAGDDKEAGLPTSGTIDESAILYDDDNNAVQWMLSAQRDVGVNMIRYHYEKVAGSRPDPTDPAVRLTDFGRSIYLSSIEYTGASDASGEPEDAAYRVRFIRDRAGDAKRPDILVDARNGFLEVRSELLRRVEVWYGEPKIDAKGPGPEDDVRVTRTDYDELAVAYDLKYRTGAFSKTLLESVTQSGADGTSATHTFTYYDRVRDAAGTYDGFDDAATWSTSGDTQDLSELLIQERVTSSVLGSSLSDGADVRMYYGFNPTVAPSKQGSIGGSWAVNFAAVEGLTEFIDINGDTLPDKVYRGKGSDEAWKTVYFQLNDGKGSFGAEHKVAGLAKLSNEYSVGVAGAFEAYLAAQVVFMVSGDVAIGDDYFTDVNSDGLIDFVSADTVYFNRLVPSNGTLIPTFQTGSTGTRVPVESESASLPVIDDLVEAEAARRAQSPLHDTVRRWTAPFGGTVSITGSPVLLEDRDPATIVDGARVPSTYEGDGVRVAIQRNEDDELWTATLGVPGDSANLSNVSDIDVEAGSHIYFRVGSKDDGTGDDVAWFPEIEYTAVDDNTLPLAKDVNGLSQMRYDGAADFTLAGRPGSRVLLPLDGTVHVETTVRKARATTDDATVQILLNGTVVKETVIAGATVDPTGITVEDDIDVDAPTDSAHDEISLRLVIDSPVDLTAYEWRPRLWYTAAQVETDSGTQVLETFDEDGNPIYGQDLPPDADLYPVSRPARPAAAWAAPEDATATATVKVPVSADHDAGTIVFTVKTRDGLVDKTSWPVAKGAAALTFDEDVEITLEENGEYFFDVSVRDPGLGDFLGTPELDLEWTENGQSSTAEPPITLHTTGRQGVFPVGYRGWAYAGYAADGDLKDKEIVEAAFDIDPDAFPEEGELTEPTGFEDPDFKNPAPQEASLYYASWLTLLDDSDTPVDVPVWRGGKVNLGGAAGLMRASRLGASSPSLGVGAGGSVSAVRRIGLTLPTFGLTVGFGPAAASFAGGPSFGLLDYLDLNGDGFPDIVAPGYVKYTDPRGGYEEQGAGVAKVNRDTTFAVSGGLSGAPIGNKANAKGNTNATGGQSAGKGGGASEKEYGGELGLGVSLSGSFTNPNTADPDFNDKLEEGVASIPSDPAAALSETLADVNGDTLPDRVYTNPDGVWVQFNTGYGFDTTSHKWSGGGFDSAESYSASIEPGLGFSLPGNEFSGGLFLGQSIDLQRYAWVDVDGDGILDRLHKNSEPGVDRIDVNFGSGAGLIFPSVPYGDMAKGDFRIGTDTGENDPLKVPTGTQIVQDTATASGGGFDFTIALGPLCLPSPTCYIILNPGAHFERAVSNTDVDLVDVNGDGAPDSVKSRAASDELFVSLNKKRDTNLLSSVSNPLGGSFELGYARSKNTTDRPASTWDLAWVRVMDGHDVRSGTDDLDGKDSLLSTFSYSGGRYDPLLREDLGFARIVETQRDDAGDDDPTDDPAVRTVTRTYLNDTVFEAGLLTEETLATPPSAANPDGLKLKEAVTTWSFRDLRTQDPAELDPAADDPAFVRRLSMAVAPLATKLENRWFDDAGNLGEATWTTFKYDRLGNAIHVVDVGEPEDPSDDLISDITFSNCTTSASEDFLLQPRKDGQENDVDAWTCPGADPPGPNSPVWFPEACPTWTSIPAVIEITNAAGTVLRHRDGAPALCDNSSVTMLVEQLGDGEEAITELNYDSWGSYNRIAYPLNGDPDSDDPDIKDSRRYTVVYEWDEDRHSDIAVVTDFDLRPDSADVLIDDLDVFLADAADDDPVLYDPDDDQTTDPRIGDHDNDPTTPDELFDPDNDPATDPYIVDTVSNTLEFGLTSKATFDGVSGRIASRTDSSGNTTSYRYDDLGRIAGIIGPKEAGLKDPADATKDLLSVAYEYDLDASPAHATASHYDSQHPTDRILSVAFMDGMGRTTQTKQDATLFRGRTAAAEDRMVVSGLLAWDELGRLVREHYPVDEPLNQAGTFNPTVPAGVDPTVSTWTLQDQPESLTLPDGVETTTDYGFAEVPGGGPTVFETVVTDGNDNPSATFTDVRDNTLVVELRPVDEAVLATTHTYSPLGELLTTTDSNGRVTANEYDLAGRRTATTTPDVGRVDFGVDPYGNVFSETYPAQFAAGMSTLYYTSFNGLTKIKYPSMADDVTYTYGLVGEDANGPVDPNDDYNGVGRIVRIEDGARITDLEYDSLGNVTAEISTMKTHNWESDPQTYTTAFEYDGFGRMLSTTYPDGEVVSYGYDSGGLLESIAGVQDGRTQPYVDRMEYDEFLVKRYERLGNGVESEFAFKPTNRRLERIRTDSPARMIQNQSYEYDDVGNPTKALNEVPPPAPGQYGGPSTQTYDYDGYYRLDFATGSADTKLGVRSYSLDLGYDADGNIRTKVQTDKLTPAKGRPKVQTGTTYTYDPINYSDSFPHRISSIGTNEYHYDLNGNFTGITDARDRWTRRVTWDHANRMRSVNDGSSTTDYTYDDKGRLAIERGPGGETAFVNRFVSAPNGAPLYKHIWADDERIAAHRVTTNTLDDGTIVSTDLRYYLTKDLQGSSRIITDMTGEIFERREFTASGETWMREDSTIFRTPFLFADAYFDEVRGLSNFDQRWYEPRTQMFLSADPYLTNEPAAAVGDPGLLGAYTYAQHNPLKLVDPTGLNTMAGGPSAKAALMGASRIVAAHALPRLTASVTGGRLIAGASRLWSSIKAIPQTFRSGGYQEFSERFDAPPMMEFQWSNDGESITLSNLDKTRFDGVSFFGRKPKWGDTAAPGADGNGADGAIVPAGGAGAVGTSSRALVPAGAAGAIVPSGGADATNGAAGPASSSTGLLEGAPIPLALPPPPQRLMLTDGRSGGANDRAIIVRPKSNLFTGTKGTVDQ